MAREDAGQKGATSEDPKAVGACTGSRRQQGKREHDVARSACSDHGRARGPAAPVRAGSRRRRRPRRDRSLAVASVRKNDGMAISPCRHRSPT